MYETKTRNVVITIVSMALSFTAWVLSGVFEWPNVEWIVGTILGLGGFSAVRALGDYRRTDTQTPSGAQIGDSQDDPDERVSDEPETS